MQHVIAIVALGAACIVWWLVQTWAARGREDHAAGGDACGACSQREVCHERPLPAATHHDHDRAAAAASGFS